MTATLTPAQSVRTEIADALALNFQEYERLILHKLAGGTVEATDIVCLARSLGLTPAEIERDQQRLVEILEHQTIAGTPAEYTAAEGALRKAAAEHQRVSAEQDEIIRAAQLKKNASRGAADQARAKLTQMQHSRKLLSEFNPEHPQGGLLPKWIKRQVSEYDQIVVSPVQRKINVLMIERETLNSILSMNREQRAEWARRQRAAYPDLMVFPAGGDNVQHATVNEPAWRAIANKFEARIRDITSELATVEAELAPLIARRNGMLQHYFPRDPGQE